MKVLQFRYLQQISCLARSNQPENIKNTKNMFEFDMEDYLSPESFALLGGFFVFVFLIWYNEVDRIIFEDNAPNNLGGNHEHRNRNQRKRVGKIFIIRVTCSSNLKYINIITYIVCK